jgi:hypothetical protein
MPSIWRAGKSFPTITRIANSSLPPSRGNEAALRQPETWIGAHGSLFIVRCFCVPGALSCSVPSCTQKNGTIAVPFVNTGHTVSLPPTGSLGERRRFAAPFLFCVRKLAYPPRAAVHESGYWQEKHRSHMVVDSWGWFAYFVGVVDKRILRLDRLVQGKQERSPC